MAGGRRDGRVASIRSNEDVVAARACMETASAREQSLSLVSRAIVSRLAYPVFMASNQKISLILSF